VFKSIPGVCQLLPHSGRRAVRRSDRSPVGESPPKANPRAPRPKGRGGGPRPLHVLAAVPLSALGFGWGDAGLAPVPGRAAAALQSVSAGASAAGSGSSSRGVRRSGGFAQERGYAVSVGRVTVGAGGGDAFSRPDYRVEIQRRDPPVLRRIHELADRMDGWREESVELGRAMAPLLEKRRRAEVEPGPELTDAERRRLAELEELTLAEAGAQEVRELRALTEKREKSELRPGPPLTPDELAALEELRDSAAALEARVSAAAAERGSLLDAVVGYTATVDSEEKTVHFGSRPVLTVYPDDILLIRVVDVDISDDDVYGVHQLRVTAEMLGAGAFELGPTLDRGIRALELNFRPADSGTGPASPSKEENPCGPN